MIDSSGDGWNEALAELYVNGEYVEDVTLEEGSYEMRVVGLGVDCDAIDPGSAGIMMRILQMKIGVFPCFLILEMKWSSYHPIRLI